MDKEVFDLTTKIPDFVADASGMDITFHRTFAEAQSKTNAITTPMAYENEEPQVQTLFVNIAYAATGCFRIAFLDIRVEHQPIILPPSQDELTVCDTNGQGIGEFNLAALIPGMVNGDPDVQVAFYLTSEDAVNGINAIPNPQAYINAIPYIQFIYAGVTDSRSGCTNITPYELKLIVEPAPQSPALDDLTFCDDADNNINGTKVVDLTVQTVVIADALGIDLSDIPALLKVEYYTTEAGARSGLANRITNPTTYTGTNGAQIWVRVEDPDTHCFSVESFTLIINTPLVLTTPTPFVKCNEALPNDGQTEFDLTQKDDEILGAAGQGQGYTVQYYESDPKTGAAPIANPTNYTNPAVPNPKTLYVKVTNDLGCVSYTTLTIKVLALPVPDTTPDPLVMCDDNAPDGTEVFDLTQAEADIKDNGSNYELSYFTTEADANNNENPIATPTAYTSASGTIYVRVALNNGNPAEPKCAQVVALELIVNPLPPIADLEPYAICEQNTDGAALFDIQGYVNTALGGNTSGEYDVDIFTDAALTTPAVPVNAYPVTGGSATVYVRVVNLTTKCQIVKELALLVEESAIANAVTTEFDECDYEGANDGIITWNLTPAGTDALGTQSPADYQVTYYETQQDAENAENAIANPAAYANTTADDMTIWIRVTNTATVSKCHDITSFTLHVERLAEPEITGPDGSNTICVDADGTTDGLLLSSGITPNGHTYTWYKNGVEITGADPASGTYLAMEEGNYEVVVTGPAPNECVSEPSPVFSVIKSGIASPIGKGYYVTNYFSDNQVITVVVEGNGQYQYQLDNGPRQDSPVFTNVPAGPHKVTVYDVKTQFSCGELVLDGVSIVDYPNFFTPNGDGFHDTWNI
ncbi:MAG: hypothetical protein AAGC65_25860, partial [Mucilaginibacter sp.]|uniref:hypothetical protein n=1 Tax=Mucilaginibacter sp. TaxID=1882438 RepID=UPI0031A55D8D